MNSTRTFRSGYNVMNRWHDMLPSVSAVPQMCGSRLKRNPNYIVNVGGASAADVAALIMESHQAVLQRCGVDLEFWSWMLSYMANRRYNLADSMNRGVTTQRHKR